MLFLFFFLQMSHRGSDSEDLRRSSRLAKGKDVVYAQESSIDTDNEYDVMENPCTCVDRVVVENLQQFFDLESDDVAEEVRPPPGPGITIGGSARSSGTPRRSYRMPAGSPPVRTLLKRPRAA